MESVPFTIAMPEQRLADMLRRVAATNWPDDVDNEDGYYGIRADYLRELADYWVGDFDWRAVERQMNGYRHYRTHIDGFPIHYMRLAGKGPRPMPLILSHGWPWTFWDMRAVAEQLADPAAFGGDPADAFDVIVPSLPGFGFSVPVPRRGQNFWTTADLWHQLMTGVLGFECYAAAGGDWGAAITSQIAHKYADSLHGIHLLHPVPPNQFSGGEPAWDLTRGRLPDGPPEVRQAFVDFFRPKASHFTAHVLDSQTLSYAMHDSPVGLLAWLLKRRLDWGDTGGEVESVFPREHLVATASLYWLTDSFSTSLRYYADAVRNPWTPAHDDRPMMKAPAGFTFLGGEFPPGVTLENRIDTFRAGPVAPLYNVHYVNAHARGGHFGHYENPAALIGDIRATFRSLR